MSDEPSTPRANDRFIARRGQSPVRRRAAEKAVQYACKQYLRLRGAAVWDTSQPMRALITPGLPDLVAFLPRPDGGAELVFIECKAPGGRLSPAQAQFRAAALAAGVRYLVAASAAELAAALDAPA